MSSTSPKGSFVLTRATVKDLPAICDLMYDAFPESARLLFMGCKSKSDLPNLAEKYKKTMQEDKPDVWIQIHDSSNGRMVAASNWKVYVNGEPMDLGDVAPNWVDAEQRAKSEEVMQSMRQARMKAMPNPFIRMSDLPLAY